MVVKSAPETTTTVSTPFCVTITETATASATVLSCSSCSPGISATVTETTTATVTETTTVSATETVPVNTASFCQSIVPLVQIANGTQSQEIVCSDTAQGLIPSVDNMASTLIKTPENNAIVGLNQDILVEIISNNINLGFFSNPTLNYYSDPQTLDPSGKINGHIHISLEKIEDIGFPDAKNPVFFRGFDQPSVTGQLSTIIPGNVIVFAGLYRVCTITTSGSHQPVLMPIARRGSVDDCIRITVL